MVPEDHPRNPAGQDSIVSMAEGSDDELYPVLPPELVPSPVQLARLPKQPWWKVVAVALAGIATIAVVAFLVTALFGSFGSANRAQVETAYRVARAELSLDAGALKALVPAATVAAVGEARWSELASAGPAARTVWRVPTWDGETLSGAFTLDGKRWTLLAEPHGQDPNVVALVVSTPAGGQVSGYVRLVPEGAAYKATFIRIDEQDTSFAPADANTTFGP